VPPEIIAQPWVVHRPDAVAGSANHLAASFEQLASVANNHQGVVEGTRAFANSKGDVGTFADQTITLTAVSVAPDIGLIAFEIGVGDPLVMPVVGFERISKTGLMSFFRVS
jgi:hypothetical protein